MLKEIIIAFQSYLRAHRFIREHKLWKWILLPGLFYAILFLIGMVLFWSTTETFVAWIFRISHVKEWLENQHETWLNVFFIFTSLVLRLVIMSFYFSIFKYLFLIIGSPIFAYLSERTEAILEGKDFPFQWNQFVKDVVRGVRLSLRNLLWQSVYMFSIFLLSLIPLFGWITPFIAFLVECYYYGFSMIDYTFERRRLTMFQSIRFVSQHKGLAIGNGIVFYSMHLILFVGWLFAPSYAVVAATLSIHKLEKEAE